MSETLSRIVDLVRNGEVRISAHGYDEMAEDGILAGEASGRSPTEKAMTARHHIKLVRDGQYVAEVDVELIDEGDGWSPYLSLDDAYKLDEVREALRRGDIQAASRLARTFSLMPVSP